MKLNNTAELKVYNNCGCGEADRCQCRNRQFSRPGSGSSIKPFDICMPYMSAKQETARHSLRGIFRGINLGVSTCDPSQ